MAKLTHFNQAGEAHMVDIGAKKVTHRIAIATGRIAMQADTLMMINEGQHKKGDVLGIARIAGIMAAKKTSELIPLCHPLPLSKVEIELTPHQQASTQPCVICTVTAETHHVTGVEMEALTAVTTTLLTIYDMCKSMDKGMTLHDIHLVEKRGGKSGVWKKQTSSS